MTHAIMQALADAFMEVGIFVALLVAGFGWLRWRHGDRLLGLAARPGWAPLLGAVLGVSPGCAGAILVMPLFARGTVSFGCVIAALVATMGDSSWVVMASDPGAALTIHGVLLASGIAAGYTVDALHLRPATVTVASGPPAAEVVPSTARATSRRASRGASDRTLPSLLVMARATTSPPLAVAMRAAEPSVIVAFWLLAVTGSVVAVPTAFQLVDPTAVSTLGGGDPYLAMGVGGTLVALLITAYGRMRFSDDTVETAIGTSRGVPFTSVLRHGAEETSFVVSWVASAYVAWAVVRHVTGFDGSQLPLAGLAGVVVGALVGLIPGCAVQIVFTGLYLSGLMPFSTLIANALSQDGDALLPLLAEQPRAALLATCLTTVPGLLVGTLCLALA